MEFLKASSAVLISGYIPPDRAVGIAGCMERAKSRPWKATCLIVEGFFNEDLRAAYFTEFSAVSAEHADGYKA